MKKFMILSEYIWLMLWLLDVNWNFIGSNVVDIWLCWFKTMYETLSFVLEIYLNGISEYALEEGFGLSFEFMDLY